MDGLTKMGEPVNTGAGYRCPKCDSLLDGATVLNEDGPLTPEPGDYSVCAYCRVALVFGTDAVHVLTDQEFMALPDEVRHVIAHTQVMLQKIKARQ